MAKFGSAIKFVAIRIKVIIYHLWLIAPSRQNHYNEIRHKSSYDPDLPDLIRRRMGI
jgi:hypothetical protein